MMGTNSKPKKTVYFFKAITKCANIKGVELKI